MNPSALNARLLRDATTLLPVWLPDGCAAGEQWAAGDYIVNLRSGRWWYWGEPNATGDTLTALYAHITGREYTEAAAEVAEDVQPVMAPSPVAVVAPLTLSTGGALPEPDVRLYTADLPSGMRGRPPAAAAAQRVVSLDEAREQRDYEGLVSRLCDEGEGKPIMNEANVERLLLAHPAYRGKIWLNSFSEIPHVDERAMTDFDFLDVLMHLQGRFPKLKLHTVQNAMVHLSKITKRDPIMEWLEGLRWDGTERMERMLVDICGAPDDELSYHAARHIMLSMVARQYLPGTMVHELIILEGAQGTGKSQFVERLAGGYYSNGGDATFGTNDYVRLMRGVLIMEIGELAAWFKSRTEQIKNFISTSHDQYVDKFDKLKTVWARRCIFIGTTNESTYLQDTTGNRRFIPIRCTGRIDLGKLTLWREQLFAEAVHVFKSDRNNWYRPFGIDAEEAQAGRVTVDPWQERIAQWVAERPNAEPTTADLWVECLGEPLARLSRQDAGRIQHVMRMAGYESTQVRRGQGRVSVWRRRVV